MVIWGMLTWWYTDGWYGCLVRLRERLGATIDLFSIDLLVQTLFAPFRQIAAGPAGGSFDMQLRAFFDRLVSRCIGTVVRLAMIIIGSIAIVCHILLGSVWLIIWALMPLLPIIGLVLSIAGWVPWIT